MEDVLYDLKLLKEEDIIWYIYFFIIIFALITNEMERYDIKNNTKEYDKIYKTINTIILIVALFIYLYFFKLAVENYYGNDKYKKEKLIIATLFLIAGAYSLYVDIISKTSELNIGIV